MKKVKSKALTLLIILLFGASTLFGATLVVDDDAICMFGGCIHSCQSTMGISYKTIQSAINAASNNDTIEICKGTYNESVGVTQKKLTLKGVDGQSPSDVVIDANSSIGITIQKKSITLENFTVKSSNKHGIYGDGNAEGKHIFKHLIIEAGQRGIYLDKGQKQTFEDLNITAENFGIYASGNVNGNHTLKSISINSTGAGIYFENGFSSLSDSNITSTNDRGVVEKPDRNTTISNVEINAKKKGILFNLGANVDITVKNSSITSTQPNDGIYVSKAKKLTVDSVCIKKAKSGIYASRNVKEVDIPLLAFYT